MSTSASVTRTASISPQSMGQPGKSAVSLDAVFQLHTQRLADLRVVHVKRYPRTLPAIDASNATSLRRERDVLQHLAEIGARTDFLQAMLGWWDDGHSPYVVFEHAGRPLTDWIKRSSSEVRPLEDRARIFADLLMATRYLHESAGLIHGAISPSSVFIFQENFTGVVHHVHAKLGNFINAHHLGQHPTQPIFEDLRYVAPELVDRNTSDENRGYNRWSAKSDTFSLWRLFEKIIIYPNDLSPGFLGSVGLQEDLLQAELVIKEQWPTLVEDCRQCTSIDPDQRPLIRTVADRYQQLIRGIKIEVGSHVSIQTPRQARHHSYPETTPRKRAVAQGERSKSAPQPGARGRGARSAQRGARRLSFTPMVSAVTSPRSL